ncbi:MAG: ABC transporter ATP-binding protein [Candidatus Baldrarchaeia archaeon]
MTRDGTVTLTALRTEFMPEEDPFEKVRKKGPIRWIIAHIMYKSNKFFIFLSFLLGTLSSILNSQLMIVIGNAIDAFTIGDVAKLKYFVTLVFLLAIGTPVLNLISNLLRETVAQRIERDVRYEFYTNLLGKSQSFHDMQRIGDIMARATNDVRMLNFLVSPGISQIFRAVLQLVVPTIFIALYYPSELLLCPLVFTVLFLITLWDYNRKLSPVTVKLRMKFGQMNTVLTEIITGIEVVKGSSQEKRETERYSRVAKEYCDAFIKQGEIQAKYIPLLLVGLVVTFGLGHAILLNLQGLIGVGQIIAYVGLLGTLRFPTFISIWAFAMVRLAIAGAERLLEIMNKETEIDENPKGIVKRIEGAVKFENVSFKYPGNSNYVLRNISFEVKPGQTVAIVGTTGSGKTTLTKLLSRLYDVTEGRILIDGIDIREYNLECLRSQIAYIEQDIFLFSTTIFENISFGRTSSLDEVIKVAKEAQAHDFISSLPNGYYTVIGERGVTLSGGEKQRVAIARAFLTNPRILILDDSTSAIDSETEDKIQRAIFRIQKGRTTFIITHRLSQIRWADLILVMKRGRIIAQGTHEELLRTCEEYKKIFVKRFDVDISQLIKGADG